MRIRPQDNVFVLRSKPGQPPQLPKQLRVRERLDSRDNRFVEFVGELLGGDPRKRDGKTIWNELAAFLRPSGTEVSPVFVDTSGRELFPTGVVTVHFAGPIRDQQLVDFAKDAGLQYVGRAKFTEQEAHFRPDEAEYLPEVLERLGHKKGVEEVWPETRAAYTRLAAG